MRSSTQPTMTAWTCSCHGNLCTLDSKYSIGFPIKATLRQSNELLIRRLTNRNLGKTAADSLQRRGLTSVRDPVAPLVV